jgi:uncharacterized membrane protein YheB (UPF0754 family)
MQSEV